MVKIIQESLQVYLMCYGPEILRLVAGASALLGLPPPNPFCPAQFIPKVVQVADSE